MKKYIEYVLEETLPINESAKICTTPLMGRQSIPRFHNNDPFELIFSS